MFRFLLLCSVAIVAPASLQPVCASQSVPVATTQALMDKASAASSRGDFRAALDLWRAVVDSATADADRQALARGLSGLGWAQWGTGDYQAARASHERSLQLFTELGDARGEALAHVRLGETAFSLARYEEALAHYERALAANGRDPSPVREAQIRSNMGSAYRFLGRFDAAHQALDAALAICRAQGDKPGASQALTFLGIVSRAQGQYAAAIAYYTEAIALRQETGDLRGEAQARGNLGNVYLDLGEYEKAVEAFSASLERATRAGYTAQIGFSQQSLGAVYSHLERTGDALSRYEAAAEIWRKIGRRAQIGWTLRNIGVLKLFQLHDRAGARPALEEALQVAREIKDPELEGSALIDLGDLEALGGGDSAAQRHYADALTTAQRMESPTLEYSARAARGRSHRLAGRLADAIADLEAAARIVNDLRANVESDSSKIAFTDTRQSVFSELALALSAAGRHDAALEAAEAGRARALADLLGGRDFIGTPSRSEAVASLRKAVAEASAPSGGPERRGGGATVEAALQRVRAVDDELASLVAVESPRIEEIRATAARLNAAIVEYLVTQEAVLAWVVTPDGRVHAERLRVRERELEQHVRTVVEAIGSTGGSPAGARAPVRRALSALHAALVVPLEAWLPRAAKGVVVIVPHGPLARLPFAALRDRAGRPFVDLYAHVVAPSAAIFRYTPRKARSAAASGAVIFADPVVPAGAPLSRLPGGRVEGQRVASRLSALQATLHSGGRATESAAKRLASNARVVHFATHGVISTRRPRDSALLLAEGDGEDGYLRVAEVFSLGLRADLVVLSGCSTGLGPLTGDGIFGLGRAFLYAGTPSIVVSLWDVNDRATAFFMDRFYAELTRPGRTKASALRAAQRAARARYSDPALWAPFILLGEPQ